jgi:hypothetical protein
VTFLSRLFGRTARRRALDTAEVTTVEVVVEILLLLYQICGRARREQPYMEHVRSHLSFATADVNPIGYEVNKPLVAARAREYVERYGVEEELTVGMGRALELLPDINVDTFTFASFPNLEADECGGHFLQFQIELIMRVWMAVCRRYGVGGAPLGVNPALGQLDWDYVEELARAMPTVEIRGARYAVSGGGLEEQMFDDRAQAAKACAPVLASVWTKAMQEDMKAGEFVQVLVYALSRRCEGSRDSYA